MVRSITLLAIVITLSLTTDQSIAQTAHPIDRTSEDVTVTGSKSREVLRGFVQSFATPARITGKLARWENGICPLTLGLRREAIAFINGRVKDVAARVGAPIDGRDGCKPNIEIVFTTSPQGLMDWVRQKHPDFLGYHDNSIQADRLASVTHPIQAWYRTATRDFKGQVQIDAKNIAGGGVQVGNVYLPDAKAYAVSGTRLGDGLSSGFNHVIVAIDPGKMAHYEMGSLADYIAMLALTQLNALDSCQQLPSIVNMLAQGCAQKPSALTENDIAYLQGLYRMRGDQSLVIQKDQVSYRMEQELKGH
jgi:hypothetical protein